MRRRDMNPVRAGEAPGYPSWGRSSQERPADPSRRRFLRQVGAAAGGVGLLSAVGLPELAHGQSREVDFSVLEVHPAQAGAEVVPAPPAPPPAAAPATTAAPAQPPASSPAPAEPAAADEVSVTEDRALWIEPGYLILIRWVRSPDDLDVVAGLEGSTGAIEAYLGAHVTEYDDLHDLARLHGHENAVVELIGPRIEPARIEKLHLDHDCNSVCGSFGWTGHDTGNIPLPGVMPAPDW